MDVFRLPRYVYVRIVQMLQADDEAAGAASQKGFQASGEARAQIEAARAAKRAQETSQP